WSGARARGGGSRGGVPGRRRRRRGRRSLSPVRRSRLRPGLARSVLGDPPVGSAPLGPRLRALRADGTTVARHGGDGSPGGGSPAAPPRDDAARPGRPRPPDAGGGPVLASGDGSLAPPARRRPDRLRRAPPVVLPRAPALLRGERGDPGRGDPTGDGRRARGGERDPDRLRLRPASRSDGGARRRRPRLRLPGGPRDG